MARFNVNAQAVCPRPNGYTASFGLATIYLNAKSETHAEARGKKMYLRAAPALKGCTLHMSAAPFTDWNERNPHRMGVWEHHRKLARENLRRLREEGIWPGTY